MRTPEEKLLNPRPGSKIAEARDYGIDLTLLVSNLRLSAEERMRKNDDIISGLDILAEAMRKARQAKKNQ
ncbi:MAG TPA: hypothetical protein PLP07_10440 [Pyrinomonadaceae bacterium]|nr:hypothetical protein [Chloracidobacterium sp.]MBP9934770.1 hypothetical protein [Pyrinomonadaceae bacterium]MBK7803199.1 hypothetical protein [Chloracidobacterium sp.]MBK9767553.1 hypothetical protein [Chloracidobacterium sp.]MBL0240970.1 hypothetical protein [Chloracidobacterium sp.]